MITSLLCTTFLLGNIVTAPNQDTIEALEKRGLSTRLADLPSAVEQAFAKNDKELLQALSHYLFGSEQADLLADQVIRLYSALPDGDFKKSIAFSVAFGLQNVDRVMQSKWACDFYKVAIEELFAESTTGRDRVDAKVLVKELSSRCGLMLEPYLARTIFDVPKTQPLIAYTCMKDLEDNWSFVTPAMAYNMVQRFSTLPGMDLRTDYFTTLMERAKSLLNAKQLPRGASREEVLRQLDAMIEAEGKKLCDKYGKIEYVPAPPPAPPSPENIRE